MDFVRQVIDEIIGELEFARKEFLEVYFHTTYAQVLTETGKWSLREVARHLELVEIEATKLLHAGLRVGKQHQIRNGQEIRNELLKIREGLLDQSIKAVAPKIVAPDDIPAEYEPLQALQNAHRGLIEALHLRTPEELVSYSFAHPLLGEITLLNWAASVAFHERRHTAQLKALS